MYLIEKQQYRVSVEFFEVEFSCNLHFKQEQQVTRQRLVNEATDRIKESISDYCGKEINLESFEPIIEVIEHTGLGFEIAKPIHFNEIYEKWGSQSTLKVIHQTVRIRQEVADLRCHVPSIAITSPDVAVDIVSPLIRDDDRECLLVLMMNTKNHVIGIHQTSVGSLNSSIVNPREVLKSCILNNASSVMIFHQHPSGDLQESVQDVEVTERLNECCKLLGIDFLDHIILAFNNPNFNSLRQKGYIKTR